MPHSFIHSVFKGNGSFQSTQSVQLSIRIRQIISLKCKQLTTQATVDNARGYNLFATFTKGKPAVTGFDKSFDAIILEDI